jgi:hypothetical protein
MNLEGLTEKRNKAGTIYYENGSGEIIAKVCKKCGEIKTIDDYTNAKKGLGNKDAKCRTCKIEIKKEWQKQNPNYDKQYYEENKTRILLYQENYQREFRDDVAERQRKWKKNNSERVREYKLKWRIENKEQERARSRAFYDSNQKRERLRYQEWRKNNPEKVRLKDQRRRARKASLPNDLTIERYTNETLPHFENACAFTGRTDNLEMDHAIPISIGHGGTTFENCYPMANGLNQSKGNKNIFEWFEANRQRFNLEQERFDRLVEWLGKANGMTAEEYRAYVYECHANPNVIDDEKENAKADGILLAI